MFVFGITLAALGALFGMPEVRERIHVDLAQQGDIFLLLYFGVFLSTIIVGPVIDSFGNKIVLTLSAVLVVAGLLGFSVARSFFPALSSAFILGFGGGGLNTAANALVADLYPDNRGTMLNLLGVFYGCGAVLIVSSSMYLLPVGMALSAISAIVYVVLPFPRPKEAVGFSLFASVRAAKYPMVMVFAALLFCESGNESAIGSWTATYTGSNSILAAYWAGLMAGRLLGAKILAYIRKERLVFMSGIGSAIGTAILVGSKSLMMMSAGAVIVGLSFAAIYPTTLAIAADRYERLAGTIFGLLFATGLLGAMAFPWVIGQMSEHFGLRAGMMLPLFGAVVIVLLVSVISRQKGER
ncbi:MAG: MFS transporter [Acidobacteriota bacterium]|nr:MFS transporter [Acidobacteriota bacterium]